MITRLAFIAVLLSSCCVAPWAKYPRGIAPDEAYSLGDSVHGYAVYAWRCDEGHHVVVYQRSAEWVCESPVREVED
jgi:hypothetical protein